MVDEMKYTRTIETIIWDNNEEEIRKLPLVIDLVVKEFGIKKLLYVWIKYNFQPIPVVEKQEIIVKNNDVDMFEPIINHDFYEKYKKI